MNLRLAHDLDPSCWTEIAFHEFRGKDLLATHTFDLYSVPGQVRLSGSFIRADESTIGISHTGAIFPKDEQRRSDTQLRGDAIRPQPRAAPDFPSITQSLFTFDMDSKSTQDYEYDKPHNMNFAQFTCDSCIWRGQTLAPFPRPTSRRRDTSDGKLARRE